MKKFLFLFIVILSALAPFSARAANTIDRIGASTERIFYFTGTPSAYDALAKHATDIDILAPQSYALNADGTLHGDIDSRLRTFVVAHPIKLMPLIVNANFSRDGVHQLLSNPASITTASNALVDLAVREKFYGLQFDIEHIPAEDRDLYSSFIETMASALHQHGIVVSVAVGARFSENPIDYPDGSYQYWSGAFDYARLGAAADFLSLMAYDQPNSGGPVASIPWTLKVTSYVLNFVPHEKLSLGVPLYFWGWYPKDTKNSIIGSYRKFKTLTTGYKTISHGYNYELGAPWIKLKTKNGSLTLWYENYQNFRERLGIIYGRNLRGYSAWTLGLEDPALWKVLK